MYQTEIVTPTERKRERENTKVIHHSISKFSVSASEE